MTLKDRVKNITRRQWLILAYLPLHLAWYLLMEAVVMPHYTVIYSPLDDLIPFCEWFIFPYLSWFLYMVVTGLYFLFNDPEAYERYMLSLFIGFFISMAIITLWPTQQNLRVEIDPDKNIASRIVNFIYNFDTNTNVFPSMHSVGASCVAVNIIASRTLRKKIGVQIFSALLCLAIITGTVVLKQHSVLDLIFGLSLETVVLIVVFRGYPSRALDKILKQK
ncbi:MAG: phosphatase PAP2 family protein [Oscillospiraceae bacterium]|jgi:membrane-associated phospholipid phosphatase|nr:phosphatase PAP2 family protein [Oscillospiraceae bacterium]